MKTYVPGDLRADQLRLVEECIDNDQPISAVKLIRGFLECGLAEANNLRKLVDQHMRRRR